MANSAQPSQPLNKRVDEVMGEIEKLLRGVRLNNNFINNVAHIYERRGYATADVYVRGKFTERLYNDEKAAYRRLLEILELINREELPPPVASFIIKKLNGIKFSKGG